MATETAKIAALESDVAKISVTQVETGLTTLESNVDAAIAAAKQAEQDEKDKEAKEKLEAAKKDLLESYTNLEKIWADKEKLVNNYQNIYNSLDNYSKEILIAIANAEKKIAAIKKSLNNDMLSAAVKSDLERRLAALEKEKTTCAETLESLLNNPMQKVSSAIDELTTELGNVYQLIVENKQAINLLTVTSDLNAAYREYQNVDIRLQDIDLTPDMKALLEQLDINIHELSLDNTIKALATLEDDVAKAIASGEEEYEKQQAEKLAKAKEDCQTAIAQYDDVINTHKSYYAEWTDAYAKLTAKMKEISDAMTVLKKQYADIQKKLQELINKQSRTRGDASEVIAALQEKLKILEENIAKLESQYSQISDVVNTLGGQIKQYDAAIKTATQTSAQLKADLASVATIAEVESLTVSVEKATSTLSSNLIKAFNTCVNYYNPIIDNLNIFINNFNTVGKQADSLQAEVETEITGIGHVIAEESEVIGRYDVKGNPVESTHKGVQIVRLKNGKTVKINVK